MKIAKCACYLLLLAAACAAAIDHCGVGCPTGGSAQTLERETYTLNNNRQRKFANWVAYKMTKVSQASNRSRRWQRDPALPATETLAPSAYRGASKALKVDRGHQAPLAGLGGLADWQTLNYLSNITPQESGLNQGAWARLEDSERALANRSDVAAVYSVTGPLFERHIATLPAAPDVEIPSGYWKIIFVGPRPDKGEYAAFLMDQTTPKNARFCDYQVTVADIERRTQPRLSFWPALPVAVSRRVKTHKGTLARALGCS